MSVALALDTEPGTELAVDEAELSRVFDLVLSEEGVERPCAVSVSVVGQGSMQALNREWRGVDAPTDVISLECERPDDPDLAPGEPCELGQIAMAPAVLSAQAVRFGTSAADETRLMAIHSLLHLLGYDHVEEGEARVMEAREDELWALACGRELAHVETTRHADDPVWAGEASDGSRPGDSASSEACACGPRSAAATTLEALALAPDAPVPDEGEVRP